MKIILNFFILSILFSMSAIAQTTENNSLTSVKRDSAYYSTYNNLKELFIKKIHSESYLKWDSLTDKYYAKWRSLYDGTGAELANDMGGLKWLKKNWERTQFKSYEEAVKEFENCGTHHWKSEVANKEFDVARRKAILKYGSMFYNELYLEMMRDYPDSF